MAEGARAITTLLLHVIVFRQRRNSHAGAAELPLFFENNLRAPVVLFHLSVDLDQPAS
jgi:hypothetical protein